MSHVLDLVWVAGSVCCGCFFLYGACLAVEFNFRASAALGRIIARLSLYESLGRNALVAIAKEEVLQTLLRPLKPQPLPVK
jgi:hypothetical protein